MWIGILAGLLTAVIAGLLLREARLTKRRREWRLERSAFDEREAAASLRILSGNVACSQRQPPIGEFNGTHKGARRDAK